MGSDEALGDPGVPTLGLGRFQGAQPGRVEGGLEE